MKSLPYYTSIEVDDTSGVSRAVCTAVGLAVERIPTEQPTANPDSSVLLVSGDEWDFEIRLESDADSSAPAPEIVIAGTPWFDNPWERGVEDDEYQRRVDRLFEVICRLTMALEVDYAPMLGFVDPLQVWPTDRPLAENIAELPIFGIYSESILEDFGGRSEMFDGSLWYVAELPSGHTVVVQADFPWNRKDWTPPRDADFLETTSVHEPTATRSSAEDTH
ncbi:hypothetical protein Natpe_0466 [Natrinema pellirubrum DSM 15624]|uniref:Uncharacterized protein n=1 Tax=Natrinema pellirubrum (strain DSM 15624 / CIP 106293 / JCM 10476 / NCIMB 786 / 157) TaxID=797303 RepID=L0JJ88_NATP1|nr:hypothetical protein [Natrinema pellirubrum]AGB30396.1 hypothetical protein Natpe_0466 [Natrinema pellirubrum DSM 15624]